MLSRQPAFCWVVAIAVLLAACQDRSSTGAGASSTSGSSTAPSGNTSSPSNPSTAPNAPNAPEAVALSGATITVDAQSVVSETGGDDLAGGRNVYSSASTPEANGGLDADWELLRTFGMNRMRIINWQEPSCILDGQGNLTPCGRLINTLVHHRKRGLVPHLVVGQWRPEFIPGPATGWGDAQWAQYQDFAVKVVRFVARDYEGGGFPEAIFEVSNELDIAQDAKDLWLVDDVNLPQFDDRRYRQLLAIYRVWSRAVNQVALETSRRLLVAGPATATGQWLERFVGDIGREGLRLDIASFHAYGGQLMASPDDPRSGVRALGRAMRSALDVTGRPGTDIWVTEWGPSVDLNEQSLGRINYSHEGASYGMAFIREALAGRVNGGSLLLVRDNFGADTSGQKLIPSYTHLLNGVEYPKPIMNAFRMFSMLPGTRRAIALPGAQPNLGAIGAASFAAAGVLVYNYNYLFDWRNRDYRDLTTTEPVAVGFTNLPFGGSVTVERYLIDGQISNLARFLDAGQTPILDLTSLQKVEQFSASVANGRLLLPQRSLGPAAVSLWMIRPQ